MKRKNEIPAILYPEWKIVKKFNTIKCSGETVLFTNVLRHLYLSRKNIELFADVFTDLNQSATTCALTFFFAQLNEVAYAGQFGWQGLAYWAFFPGRGGFDSRCLIIDKTRLIDTRIGFIK